jgi:hypothetical protein
MRPIWRHTSLESIDEVIEVDMESQIVGDVVTFPANHAIAIKFHHSESA